MTHEQPVALVTGAARRIGAVIVRRLHTAGFRVVIHCRRSVDEANSLADELNRQRTDSAFVTCADLLEQTERDALAKRAAEKWGRLDLLVNNASSFYPTVVGETSETDWDDLLGSNLKAPYFLVQSCLPALKCARGSIVNMIDIHSERPLKGHAVYSAAKAGLNAMTRALAKELGPDVRVNGVSPGAILWPENDMSEADKREIVARTPLKRHGSPEDIARAVLFLVENDFITGQILAVDGGRSL